MAAEARAVRPERQTTERWPDFYIVGAPKSGTTSLYEYLAGNPSVFLAARKELRYFGSDLEVRHRHTFSRAEFLAQYADAPADAMLGNAYVWYLFSTTAAAEIHRVRPDARIVVALRDPVDALHSLHSEFVYDGNEDIADFAAALDAEPDRCAGRRVPVEAHFPAGLCYRRTVRYAEQLGRYLDRFGRDQVHVILFDDFAADPATSYSRLLDFLRLPDDGRGAFPRRNPNKRSRSGLVRRILAAPPLPARRAVRALLPRRLRGELYRRAVALNTRQQKRAPMPDALRQMLRAQLAPEVSRLEELLGRRLPAWHAPE
jgi:hypothetical protein